MQKVMQDSTSDHLKSLVDNLTDQQMKLNSKLQQNKYLEFLK